MLLNTLWKLVGFVVDTDVGVMITTKILITINTTQRFYVFKQMNNESLA